MGGIGGKWKDNNFHLDIKRLGERREMEGTNLEERNLLHFVSPIIHNYKKIWTVNLIIFFFLSPSFSFLLKIFFKYTVKFFKVIKIFL